MEASPTVVPKSAAICGNSESVTRTIAWLAKPATASRMMERVGTFWLAGEEVTRDFVAASVRVWALTGRSAAGFLPRNRRTGT
jgi:hypothetical protein